MVSLEDYKESLKTIDQYPIQYIQNNGVIKLEEKDTTILLGILESTKESVVEQLINIHSDKTVESVYINSSELTSFLSKLNTSGIINSEETTLEENDLNKLANDAPVINLVNSIIIDGINKGASDIHIEGYQGEVILRYRIDGVLLEGDKINKKLFTPLSSRIKIMSNLNIMERRQPQDGRCSVILGDNPVDLRVSIIPLSGGESIVLRLFIKKSRLLNLEDLGFEEDKIELMDRVSRLPHGLILITGPTGSGKTTTLNALLQRVNSSEKKIITIEDPVEYNIPGVNQIQVNSEIDLSFSSILRRVLRQDPDIIMIGEIRDRETADLVIRAALTGHLVLSTLHTNDAASSLARLKDMGVPDYLITSVLRATFAQRLIRTLCPHCKTVGNKKLVAVGCSKCSNTGYKGRVALTEGFEIDEKLESLILDEAKSYEIKKHLINSGMRTLYSEGVKAVNSGITTVEELNRVLSC